MFVEAVIPPSQQQENVPSLGEREDGSASLAGRACRDRGAQAEPSTPLPSPPGPDSTCDCREELLDPVFHGSLGRELGQPCAWQVIRGSAILLPLQQNSSLLAPQTFLYLL